MLTLDEAIKHCCEKAEELVKNSDDKDCIECAGEHLQLAGWLIELKQRREAENASKEAKED